MLLALLVILGDIENVPQVPPLALEIEPVQSAPLTCREAIASSLQAHGRIDFYQAQTITAVEEAMRSPSASPLLNQVAQEAKETGLCENEQSFP